MSASNRFRTFASASLAFALSTAVAQQKVVRMPPPVNTPSVNTSSPFVSLDGKALLFLSDYTEGNVPAVHFTSTADEVNWKEPVMLPNTFNNRLNHLRGFALSPDGKQIFITSTKGGGAGGYDLYVSDQRGAFWSDPQTIGIPINSTANEASPTLSSDGMQLYFMRCERMDATSGTGCKILVATRRSTTAHWTEPVELPANINTGNSQTPRIMGDGETLIFSSDKLPGKGGMDLFMTRKEGDNWSTPVPLDFVNTPANNQYVSGTSSGRYLMTETMGKTGTELVQLLFPPDVKPKGVMKIAGHVAGLTPPTAAYISLFDRDAHVKTNTARPGADGSFVLYMKEGHRYTIAVDPEKDNFTFFMKDYDLVDGKVNTMDRLDVTLKAVVTGDELPMPQVSFKPLTAELEESSKQTLEKMSRLMKGNANMKFTVEVDLYGFRQDSLVSDPDLTEVHHDTIHFTVTKTQLDSTGLEIATTHDSVAVKTIYHNDRTVHQALEVVNYLIGLGVPASGVTPSSHVFEAIPEERKTLVKVIAR